MSIEAHPNINAAGFATAITIGLGEYLRGPAGSNKDHGAAALDLVKDDIVDFVALVSSKLDGRFGT
jgi:hypothetical protein